MKHDKKPENDLKRLTMLAAGTAASVAVLAGGVRVWNGYQNGSLFRPDLFVNTHDYQENQIMFPEKNDYGQPSQTDTSDDNHRLERDPQADDSYGRDNPEASGYQMPEDGHVETDLKNASNLLVSPETSDMPSGGNLPQGVKNSAAVIAGTSNNSSDRSVIKLPSGNGTFSGNGISGRDDSDDNSGSGASGRYPGGNASGGGAGGGGGNTNSSGTTPVPTPTPVPAPTPAPAPVPTPTPVIDPDYPNKGDKPSPPDLPPDINYPAFPSDGITTDSTEHISLTFIPSSVFDSGETLYNGAVLTDWKILCSLYVFVDVKDKNNNIVSRHRLSDYNENFRIGEFPSVANGNFTVNFYFRQNADSDWIEFPCPITVNYAKFIVLDDNGTVLSESFAEKSGDSICLLKQMQQYYLEHKDEWGDPDALNSIFPGWSLTEGGEPLGNWFTPAEPGRYVFYPVDRVSVPDGLTVSASAGWDPTHSDNCYAAFLQRLSSAPEGLDVLEVPEGIQEVGEDDFSGMSSICNIGTLVLPNTAILVYPKYYTVLDAYQVRDDNPCFSVKNGILYNKEGTKILGIPQSRFNALAVPENVTDVKLPLKNSINKIIFSSEVPPKIDLSRLYGTELVVPKEYYTAYFVAWNQYLLFNNLTLTTDDGQTPEFTLIDGGLYSDSGKVLEYVLADHSGFFTAAESLEVVRETATADCKELYQLLLGKNLKELEPYSLTAPNLTSVFISAVNPPKIDVNTFGDISEALEGGLHVIVPEESLALYQDAWRDVLGDATTQLLKGTKLGTVETASGLKYMTTDNGSILLHAPSDITSFDDIEKETDGTVLWSEIGSNAFSGCADLTALAIPDTVSTIDSNAFAGCGNLQLTLLETTGKITIKEDAFDPDSALQLVAFNSRDITFSDPDLPYKVSCFVPYDSTVNSKNVSIWGDTYTLKQGDTGIFAYGIDTLQGESYMIGATKDISGAIKPPDGTSLTQFAPYALADCTGTLTIDDSVGSTIFYIGPYAFSGSGISGDLYLGNMFQIADSAFTDCSQLHDIVIAPSYYNFTLSGYAFGDSSLERITLPPNLVTLGSAPFSYCGNLKEVIFTGPEAPTLESHSRGFDYSFGWDDWATDKAPNVKTTLQGAATEENYLKKWKYNLKGYSSENDLLEDKGFAFYYIFEWFYAAGSSPLTADLDYIPEFKEYVEARAEAEAASTLNGTIQKFYWYLDKDVPDGMIQEVVFPDIMEYVKKAEESKASDSNAQKATGSNGQKVTDSNVQKATGSNAQETTASQEEI